MSTRSAFEPSGFYVVWGQQINPAAAANLILPVPINARSELLALSFTFTASGIGGERQFTVVGNRGLISILLGGTEYPLNVGQARSFIVSATGFNSVKEGGRHLVIGIPVFPVFREGDLIIIAISGAKAGDQISDVHFCFKTWAYED